MNKRIYIFEDIDCLCGIVKDRENESDFESELDLKIKSEFELISKINNIQKKSHPEDKLNLSCLLNIFDGILEIPGRIIILTSNYPDKIDKALLRPGRIDMNLELKKSSISIIEEILSFFFDIDMNIIHQMCENKLKNYAITPALVMNICQNNFSDIERCIYELEKIINTVL